MTDLRRRAKEMRQAMTPAEKLVWRKLRGRRFASFSFRRQVPLERYILDFVCFDRRLILELDGGHHAEPGQTEHDLARTVWLEAQGFRVLRIWNHEMWKEWSAVEQAIWDALETGVAASKTPTRPPHP